MTLRVDKQSETNTFHLRKAQNGPVVAESDGGALVATPEMDELLVLIAHELAPVLQRRVEDAGEGVLMTITVEAFEG